MSEQLNVDKRTRERLSHGARDMAWSLVVLIVIVGGIAWFFGACQFSPGGPTIDEGAVQTVDADEALRRMAQSSAFAVRSPSVPEGWRATTANTAPVGTGAEATVISRVSWITTSGHYLRLAQSSAPAEQVVADEGDSGRPAAQGSVDVDGRRWTVYPWYGREKAWVTTLDGVQVMVAGGGTEAEFRALATAVQRAEPLPTG
ncbi:MAG: DUF4245 domain-containing protein [Pseudonocardiaceae bacterium]